MRINYDKTVKIGKSIINHGKYSNRIYLMKIDQSDFPEIIQILDDLAKVNGYTKIFAKIPYLFKEAFIKSGYGIEATIPGFYKGVEDVIFMGKYFSEERARLKESNKIKEIIDISCTKDKIEKQIELGEEYHFHLCDKNDVLQMCKVYRAVFETYPFPISDEKYIEKTMNENFIYFSIKHKEKIVSLASTEMDYTSKSVEMTDFATLHKYRGKGFSIQLLGKMEEEMRLKNFYMAFTIARSISYGINITFSKLNYKYGGTLINNTNISGDLESMNVWYKILNL
ncbi:MAG: putative beta-lysine N-acetyltransferase [Eubacteriales bacterium]